MTPAPHFPPSRPTWRRYVRFWRADIHADTDDELRVHFETRVEELMRGGLTRDDATACAHEEFGDLHAFRAALHDIDGRISRRHTTRERLAGLRDDVRYSLRALRRSKGLVATIVLTMALGLGINAAMFSFLDDVYFRAPVGVTAPGRVHRVWTWHYRSGDGIPFASVYGSVPAYADYVAAAGRDVQLAAYVVGPARFGRGEGSPTVAVSSTTASYLAVNGARVARGRWFTEAENEPSRGERVAIVSGAFARRWLADSSDVVGARLLLNGKVVTVIGVAGDGFTGPDLGAVDVWVPIAMNIDDEVGPRGEPWYASDSYFAAQTIARFSAGANASVIAQRFTAAARVRQSAGQYPDTLMRIEIGPINVARGPGQNAGEVVVATRLGAVAVIVLLIACANVVNLLLARSVLRAREIAIRLSLGVTRLRLVRLMTTESLLLSLSSGAAALVAAYWSGALLRKLLLPETHWGHSAVSWRLVLFTALSSIAAGLAIGLVPALRASRPDLTSSLRAGGQALSPRRSRLRSSLVATQAALAVVLLVSATLFVASLRNVEGIDIGYDAPRLTFAQVVFETQPPNAPVVRENGYRELAAELAGSPGIEGVALSSIAPMRGFAVTNFYWGADSALSIADPRDRPVFTAVSASYFRTVGLKLLQGRGFAENGAGANGVIVNERLARVLWHGANPLGQCVRFKKRDGPCFTVIGVAANSHRGQVVEENATTQFFLSLDDLPPGVTSNARVVIVRADPRNSATVATTLRDRIHRLFPSGEPLINPMMSFLDPQYRPYRLGAVLFTAFGVLAFVVALIGIYSTVSYTVQQRAHEFSIRTALGAQLRDVVSLVLGQELRVVAIGVVTGIGLVLAGGSMIASLLYGVSAHNGFVIAGVASTLLAAAVVGSFGPAWRAGRADPARTLRSE